MRNKHYNVQKYHFWLNYSFTKLPYILIVSEFHTLSGGFNQTTSSHNLWKRRRLAERCTGSRGHPSGDGTKVYPVYICLLMLFLSPWFYSLTYCSSASTDSTMWTTSWTPTWKSPVCIWRTMTRFKPRPTSTELLYFRMNPPMNSCRFTTRCIINKADVLFVKFRYMLYTAFSVASYRCAMPEY